MADIARMTHPCMHGHVFYADVISASENMLWVFPVIIPTTGGKNPMSDGYTERLTMGKREKLMVYYVK